MFMTLAIATVTKTGIEVSQHYQDYFQQPEIKEIYRLELLFPTTASKLSTFEESCL